ncbi:MAG: hypothetical protein E7586_00185 [Ruminococcaceae bacterium]|nr:hypothetical protein [Oscillospiraceae bacterium]
MLKFKSDKSVEELIKQWDEHTSISRFAGSDETMDLIYVSKRKGRKVRLVRKAPLAREPFSSVFRGVIREAEQGSEIAGLFTKSIFDYVLISAIFFMLFYIRSYVIQRGDSLATINTLIIFAIIGSVLCLYNFRATKRKYADFISGITGKETNLFLKKSEIKDKDGSDN